MKFNELPIVFIADPNLIKMMGEIDIVNKVDKLLPDFIKERTESGDMKDQVQHPAGYKICKRRENLLLP